MGPVELPAWLQPRYRKNAYLFIYYLIQFCGHSWIFTNMTVRFFSFGKGSVVDTFYAIGLVMRLCQSISLLELLHIYVGIESDHLLPRLLQLTERIIILFVVITSQEEVQEKYVVCVLFIFWNLLDMVRYTYSMLSVIGISYAVLTWLSQTLWMPIYPLCVLAEENQKDDSLRGLQPSVVCFEDGERGPQAKEYGHPLEVGKGRGMDSPCLSLFGLL
ncbi:very-long-chain (3R)-3-hydroxyacyl-CoA dehydratase 4 isoform X2 [Balaenoptera ricei]|uniref:very-long-chain (3R)-3-hydroxyacyl-CoA dehydratase 4 isoform X2 n=1 Tax=Balaenoptera ricei TaxID=2746895 RepID=UPI0028BD98DA|nr:very-long-chain (3R)-3-hydroxyacyl-CoA dehydratase 4 isoform X2 [Balaenoptera ricei]